jgi:hypothetical protein
MKIKYTLQRAVTPGEDYQADLRITEQIQREVKQQTQSGATIEEQLGLEPIDAKDYLYNKLEI